MATRDRARHRRIQSSRRQRELLVDGNLPRSASAPLRGLIGSRGQGRAPRYRSAPERLELVALSLGTGDERRSRRSRARVGVAAKQQVLTPIRRWFAQWRFDRARAGLRVRMSGAARATPGAVAQLLVVAGLGSHRRRGTRSVRRASGRVSLRGQVIGALTAGKGARREPADVAARSPSVAWVS